MIFRIKSINSLTSIEGLISVTEKCCVFCEVRTEFLNIKRRVWNSEGYGHPASTLPPAQLSASLEHAISSARIREEKIL
jgi:hypothetical protein